MCVRACACACVCVRVCVCAGGCARVCVCICVHACMQADNSDLLLSSEVLAG